MVVKIGKNTSFLARNCRKIGLYSQTMSLVIGGGPLRRAGTTRFKRMFNRCVEEIFRIELARKFAGAEVDTQLQSAVFPAKKTVGGFPCDDILWAWRSPR